MLISHRKQFIYTKTAKTAGTSVESYFEKYCMPEGKWQFSHGHRRLLGYPKARGRALAAMETLLERHAAPRAASR